jgi:hypothetical protein
MVKAKKMKLRKETVLNLDPQPSGQEAMAACTFRHTGCTSECSGPCTAC